MKDLPEGFILIVKKSCPTCEMIQPVFEQIEGGGTPFTVYTQDEPSFPGNVKSVRDDTSLEASFHLDIEAVPTLIRVEKGREAGRIIGWLRSEWESFTGLKNLGEGLPEYRPGCGSLNVEPGRIDELAIRFGKEKLKSRPIELADLEDEIEACFDRGWTDGLPVVPPSRERVFRMLRGTQRRPDDLVGIIPPDKAECTVEKVAVNAVMAGCLPEYMPVVLAAVEASCLDEFCLHGLLATTYFSGPIAIVNGPLSRAINMNSGVNALGQGNRANATIGRALQLVIRNVGGGRPGGVDRATLGNPGKYTFCFAEDEKGSPWESFSVEQGFDPGESTVSLFGGHGLHEVFDQLSREPESLTRTIAAYLRMVAHPKYCMASDAILLICPEHASVYKKAGWSKARLKQELNDLLQIKGSELVRGVGGMDEGLPEPFGEIPFLPKFRENGLHIIHAGGSAGKFSAIISGWVAGGTTGSQLVSKSIDS